MSGDHARFLDDAASYALGALEDTEVRAFEAHLAGCEQCRTELVLMQEAVATLPEAAPAVGAAPELKERVMAIVSGEAARRPDASAGRAARVRDRGPIAIRPRRFGLGQVAVALAAVAALVVVGVIVLGGGTSTRTYAGIVHAPGASASLLRSGHTATLRVTRLPAPPDGRIYEVWLERGSQPPQPTSALFTTSTGTIAVPGDMSGVRAVLVTAEPRPYGSRTPTRAPILIVRLQ